MLRPADFTIEDLREKNFVIATPTMEYRKYLKSGFSTPSQKIELYSNTFETQGYDPMPTYQEPLNLRNLKPNQREQYPLKGVSRKPYEFVHTKFRNLESLGKTYPTPLALLHPQDASQRGIHDGNEIDVESPNGTVRFSAKVTNEVQPSMVIMDFGWGNPWDKREGINYLVDSWVCDPISGGTPNRTFTCEIRKAKVK